MLPRSSDAALGSLVPRFAVEARAAMQAYLADLFPDEDNEEERETAPVAEPTPLPVTLPEPLRAELAATHAARHNWFVEGGWQQRDVHGTY